MWKVIEIRRRDIWGLIRVLWCDTVNLVIGFINLGIEDRSLVLRSLNK